MWELWEREGEMCDDKGRVNGRMEFAPAGAKGEGTAVKKESDYQWENHVFQPAVSL